MLKPLRILMVEASEDDASMVIHTLKRGGYLPEYWRVDSVEAMRDALRERRWDIALWSDNVPDFLLKAAFSILKDIRPDLPLIMISSHLGEEAAVECMRLGARDCIRKENLSLLTPAVDRELADVKLRTSLKQVEGEWRKSWDNYRLLAEATGDLIVKTNRNLHITFANRALRNLLPDTEPLGMNISELLPLNFRKMEMERMSRPKKIPGDVSSFEWETIDPQGKRLILDATMQPLEENGSFSGWLVSCRNITARKEAEEKLRQAEENYRSIFDNAQEGIYRTTPDGTFLMANSAMARILGYDSPEELIGNVTDIATQLYVQPEERTKVLGLVAKQIPVSDCELQFFRKDGRKIWVYRTMRAVKDAKGNLLYLEGLIEDITGRKEHIEQLRKGLGGAVQAISMLVEARDPYTAGHQRRVADLARSIAEEMELSRERIDGLRIAGMIHDLGKVSVPAEILSMPRRLTELEFGLIKTHAQSGYDILKEIEFPWPVARIVLEHHERLNGSGYPFGLRGNETLLESRILAVADVVEAMSTHRPYRPSLGTEAALAEITGNQGLIYDEDVVEACRRLFQEKGYTIKG
ncbi:MAG: PAS domain S-box protein [Syntrophaceae bacterium]|jgi:PAS domain S-box-containing protein|nr:PAS domain S-box protein [Syntrophaceae bacterium]HQM45716.1 PAS domain S-box protein [Smithellaceae bacterium]